MKVIEIKNKMYARKAYQLNTNEQYYLDFKPEIEVLQSGYPLQNSVLFLPFVLNVHKRFYLHRELVEHNA